MIHLGKIVFQAIVSQLALSFVAFGILGLFFGVNLSSKAQSSAKAQDVIGKPDSLKPPEIKKATVTPCVFVDSSLAFAGEPLEQAKCLLRPVLRLLIYPNVLLGGLSPIHFYELSL